ncbi:hypothetical protein M3Y99_00457800 [Aphelenchoides fujianensis]|nr:hypothetical protein M3Y99_00457800 [Aphelenchoides fujianensis]
MATLPLVSLLLLAGAVCSFGCMMDERKPGVVCLENQNLDVIALNSQTKWRSLVNNPAEGYVSSKTIVGPAKSRVLLSLQNLTWSDFDRFEYNAGQKCLHGKLRVHVNPKNNQTEPKELCNEKAPLLFVSKENEIKIEEEVVRYATDVLKYQPVYTTVTPLEKGKNPYGKRPAFKIAVRQSIDGMISEIADLYQTGAVLTWRITPPKITEYAQCSVSIIQPNTCSGDVLKVQYSGRTGPNGTDFRGGDATPKTIPRDYISNFQQQASDFVGNEKVQQKRLLGNEYLDFFYEMNDEQPPKWSVSWTCHVYANADLDEMDRKLFKPVLFTQRPEEIRRNVARMSVPSGCDN